MATKQWIQKANVGANKGGLHRATGTPSGQKIPENKVQTALHSKNAHVRHMAQFAENVKH